MCYCSVYEVASHIYFMSKIIWTLSANYCSFIDSAFGKNSYFSFRWKKDARNFQSMCFENLPPLEELFGELIDNDIKNLPAFFDKDVEVTFKILWKICPSKKPAWF